MPNQIFSDAFKKIFLIEFTTELIRNSAKQQIRFEESIEEIPKIIKTEFVKPIAPLIFPKEEKPIEPIIVPVQKIEPKPIIPTPEIKIPPVKVPMVLRIPEQRLPEAFQYLKPTATFVDIDLGKLNSLAKDSNIRIIECNGPDEQVIVEGTMGRKLTGTILNKDEIDAIIKKFSEVSKIPMTTGIHKVVVGRFIFMAIISEIVNTKFVIKKMI